MIVKILVTFLLVIILSGCQSNRNYQETVSPTPVTSSDDSTQKMPSPTPASYVDDFDLTSFAATWSEHDVSAIRTLYMENARYISENEAQKLAKGDPIEVLVSDEAFQDQVRRFEGFKMRIIGKPIGIYDKLVAFSYRWEGKDNTGYNGVAMLRFEDGRILLHVDLLSSEKTTGEENGVMNTPSSDFSKLMKAWNDADIEAASNLYTAQAVMLSDEDLAQAPWRDFSRPPQLKELLNQFSGWNPNLINQPIRIENMVIFAWRWNKSNLNYPAGYGLRLLRYDGAYIATDIRFAIRPWEVKGNTFLNP